MSTNTIIPAPFVADQQIHPGWPPVIEELQRFRDLADDWDGEGTPAPKPAIVDRAVTLARELQQRGETPPHRVHVSVNATIYFEWQTLVNYTEIEVVTPDQVEMRTIRVGSDQAEVFDLLH
jgi:hypothetical protein